VNVIKVYLLLFQSLFFFGNLSAQADSTRPLSPSTSQSGPLPDTTVRAPKPLLIHHRDSLRHDSLRHGLFRQPETSSPRADAALQGNSKAAAPSSLLNKAAGPDSGSFWKRNLGNNPSFNFLGKPVIEPFEIHHPNSKDSLFYLLVGILFYFALIRIFFEKYFNNLMTLFFRVSLRQQQIREQVLQTPLPSLLLNLLFVFTSGLFACFLLHYSRFGSVINFWILYLNSMLLIGTLYFFKFLILKFCGWVFSISRATDTYIFIVFLVNKMLGIFLLPFLILITFSSSETREIFITISLAMIFVLLAYRVLAAYRPIRNEIKLTPFHFFVYLCAFEIAPLLLIYKVLLTYLEKVY
jgi:hypothetical protein